MHYTKYILLLLCVTSFLPAFSPAAHSVPEDFAQFPLPKKGAEENPKLVYEKEDINGNKVKITTSEHETNMLMCAGFALGATIVVLTSAAVFTGKIDVNALIRSIYGSDKNSK